jgi:hypothetical protein
MSESFESFLKKHQSEATWNKYYIPTKKLGEWAWEECYKCCAREVSPHLKLAFLKEVHPVKLEIAIACLGQKEIEKRLNQIFNTAKKQAEK